MTEATLHCPKGCFVVEYAGRTRNPDIDDQDFINELGPPAEVVRNGGNCPNCGDSLSVSWGGDGGDDDQ